tara:strand:- start:657 stop:1055 length:399 start_codon:yes stop_codon:yes gene_type:complete
MGTYKHKEQLTKVHRYNDSYRETIFPRIWTQHQEEDDNGIKYTHILMHTWVKIKDTDVLQKVLKRVCVKTESEHFSETIGVCMTEFLTDCKNVSKFAKEPTIEGYSKCSKEDIEYHERDGVFLDGSYAILIG